MNPQIDFCRKCGDWIGPESGEIRQSENGGPEADAQDPAVEGQDHTRGGG